MTVVWPLVGVLLLAGFVAAAIRVQTAPTAPGRMMAGIGGAFLGILGALLIVTYVAR